MASTSPLPPPPPGMDPNAPPTAPTMPPAAVASPATPAPTLDHGMQMAINIANQLRSLAKAYPSAAPKVAQANDLLREIQIEIMKNQQPGEPAAPPMG